MRRSSKFQVPSSKEAPNPKLQIRAYPELQSHDSLVLKEEEHAKPPFDLEERSARFGESIVRFAKRVPRNAANNRLIDQLVGAGTSVGANYCEANECVSKKDFRCSIGRCKKEIKETKFFLRMIATAEPGLSDDARKLYREATELQRIRSHVQQMKCVPNPLWLSSASDWKLELGTYLELGTWNLELSA